MIHYVNIDEHSFIEKEEIYSQVSELLIKGVCLTKIWANTNDGNLLNLFQKEKVKIRQTVDKAKIHYNKIKEDGFYLRPCKYDNFTVYDIVKDIDSRTRTTKGVINHYTAKVLMNNFGFHKGEQVRYFGNHQRIKNMEILF